MKKVHLPADLKSVFERLKELWNGQKPTPWPWRK